MARVDIRHATPSDIPELCKLYLAFHEFHVRGVPERLKNPGRWEEFDSARLTGSLKEILSDPRATLFVAEDEGRLVGFAEVYIREDEPDPARITRVYGHLQSLMVADGWRNQGVGRRLVRAAEAWAQKEGASEVRLDTWEFPGDPVRFYERIGYRTLKRKLVRQL
jgi:GNAT superfamily N-acetyltransferase